jgi:acyl dehydratase
MRETLLGPYRVEAFNTSRRSDNPIHDDAVARRFGFAGGLVPGVDVYGYMTHLPVARWGAAWLERGTAECRFQKPVYDGETAIVNATECEDGLDITVECRGEVCVAGRAGLPSRAVAVPAPFAGPPPLPPAARPEADEVTLAVGTMLAIHPVHAGAAETEQYLRDLRESLPLYRSAGLVHPATIAGLGNWALKDNVLLGPWMHVGSRIAHFAVVRIGDELTAIARVTANYEKKGHRFVELDVLVYANRTTPVARLAHVSIYRPRQLTAA